MRSASEAEKSWRQLDNFHSLTDLKIHVSSHKEPRLTAGLRSVCWKIFLVFKTLDRSSWPTHLAHSRKTYESLRTHYLRAIQHPDEFESSVDPLTEIDESPWVALRADEDLRAEIFQDIERCMPDNVYFRQPATQNMMLDILFVWCKLHPDIGYRQGMHEILAPLLWVVERDAIEATGGKAGTTDGTLADMMDSRYIEHDTYTLFSLIMQTAKSFYAPAEPGSITTDTPMLARSSRIFERYLPKADPELFAHLTKLEVVPQIFLLRWIRLLFGREFPLDSVFDMWDALFAIDSSLELVDMISIAMLLRIRWDLVAADTNEAFTLLLRYPEPPEPAYTFIKDALYLRDHLTPQGGAEIISRYGKQAPVIELEASPNIRDASPSPSFVSSRTRHNLGSPKSIVGQQGAGIEALLQGAAKNVLERGSQWGVGKALRDAVGEVRKNVEAYQSGTNSGQTTPRSGGREFRKPAQIGTASNARPGLERMYSGNAMKKIEELDRRNKSLAKMLEVAVGDLWEYHRERNEEQKPKEDDETGKAAMEALSLAIAKVQFVQVYLEDSSIPLPIDEVTEQAATAKAAATLTFSQPQSPVPPERTSSVPPISVTTTSEPLPMASATTKALSPASQLSTNLSPRSRPHLTSSNFSWMLGEDSASSNFASGTTHSTFSSDEKRRMKGKGFLFGDGDDDGNAKEGKRGSVSSKGSAKSGKTAKGKHVPEVEIEEEIIDLDNMGKRGVM
ncbi:RabGAP/TBC [Cucurbitaria berberidis CBS 394.84]|uniref:RabGAP/TBC n=1 Tax=Cucurbitaria berberidis CBS 394.84 TaxID=1168544 RepID=A0A9P4GCH2_9PLEO|nr:RabGAP/TBC [Cucurbitaria berberidis CBS 394.84]KAF1843060.1 RabGAP/TBC [Cucurbitaria berberidis CBS 394.84]